jgi:hypothetical protein
MDWAHAISRPAAGPYKRCWVDVPGGQYVVWQNDPAPGTFRVWFTPEGKPEVFLGEVGNLREALLLAERDAAWKLKR